MPFRGKPAPMEGGAAVDRHNRPAAPAFLVQEELTPVMRPTVAWTCCTSLPPTTDSLPLPLPPNPAKPTITNTIMGGQTVESVKPKSTYPVRSAHPVGALIPNLYKDRIGQFYAGGQYEGDNLRAYGIP